jgi:hypothetical protein
MCIKSDRLLVRESLGCTFKKHRFVALQLSGVVNINKIWLFCFVLQQKGGDKENINFAAILVHKLVSVLESIEKLPVYLYESPGSCFGLQVCRIE